MAIFSREKSSRLQATADVAIWKSHSATTAWPARRNPKSKPPEEDFVASLVLYAVPEIARNWSALCKQWNVSLTITAVFCHNTPKAGFERAGTTESPELADLLIVRKHLPLKGEPRQVAVLIQAKMSSTGEIRLSANDPQLYLYSVWPVFKLHAIKAPKEPFSIGRHTNQALYSGIRENSPCPSNNEAWRGFCPWAMMPVQVRGWMEESLSEYFIRLLNFESGRDFYDPDTTGCDWSKLIHYLLETTFALPLRTRDVRLNDPRGITADVNRTAFMLASPSLPSAYVPTARIREIGPGGQSPLPEETQYYDGGQGRVILIETREGQG